MIGISVINGVFKVRVVVYFICFCIEMWGVRIYILFSYKNNIEIFKIVFDRLL